MTSNIVLRLSALFTLILIFPPFTQAADRKVSSTVLAVTVYRDRALIERRIQEQLPAGEWTLIVTGVPISTLDQSVRVSGEAEAATKILDVKVETVFLDTIPEQRIRQLQDRLKQLKAEQQVLLDRLAVLKSQKEYLDTLKIFTARSGWGEPVKQRSGGGDPEKFLVFLQKQLGAIFADVRETNQKLNDLKSRIDAVEREIQQSRAYSKMSQKQVAVSLQVSRTGRVQLALSYVVFGASWVPAYEARVSGDSKNLQLTYAAMVRQSTNEDWSNVSLTLSTAQPALGGTPPELYPWYVDAVQPRPLPAESRLDKSRAPAAKDEAVKRESGLAAMEVAVTPETAVIETQTTSSTFRIPSATSIPSDNSPHKVTIAVESLPVNLDYSTIPKLSGAAYLKAKAKNTTEAPFLAGSMNIFFENTFVATSTLPTVMPGEEFESSLGVDDGIRVERKLLNRLTEYSGLFTKNTKLTYDIVMKLENRKKVPVELTVKDQIPISRNEKIVVEVLSPSPKEMSADQTGTLLWRVKLNPGEKRDLPLKFSIEYPSDLRVAGIE